jgi:GNAT superfamily N-acetyltransferase
MELVELAALTDDDWTALIDGERQPWGADGEGLQWGEKDTYVALRDADGRLVAVAGAVVTTIAPQRGEDFQVVGLGSLFITRARRRAGLMERLVDPLLGIAHELGPDRAMLFCNPALVGRYRRLGFSEITAPVWVAQPHAEVQMPLRAMWLALRAGAAWPAGAVHVRGLPF